MAVKREREEERLKNESIKFILSTSDFSCQIEKQKICDFQITMSRSNVKVKDQRLRSEVKVRGQGQKFKVRVQDQRSRSEVKIRGQGQRSRSMQCLVAGGAKIGAFLDKNCENTDILTKHAFATTLKEG